jgi:hypothetical protein
VIPVLSPVGGCRQSSHLMPSREYDTWGKVVKEAGIKAQ